MSLVADGGSDCEIQDVQRDVGGQGNVELVDGEESVGDPG